MGVSKNATTKFFLLNPTKEKVIVSFGVSLVLILVFLTIPSLGFQAVFLSSVLSRQIISLIGSLLFSFIVYYPFSCGLVYFFKTITGKEKVTVQNFVIALLFIVIFNIITFSLVTTNIMKNIQVNSPSVNSVIDAKTKEKLCGLQIIEVTAPSAKNAGLVAGEVIKTINGYPIGNMKDLNYILANKRPNDIVSVKTNANTYTVTLFANTQNPQQVLLGIKVKPTDCGK